MPLYGCICENETVLVVKELEDYYLVYCIYIFKYSHLNQVLVFRVVFLVCNIFDVTYFSIDSLTFKMITHLV